MPQVALSVTSTNEVIKKMAREGASEGTVLAAAAQEAGKGRLGRRFFSPPGTGVYLSLLLRPAMAPEERMSLTLMAAAAGARAMEEVRRIVLPSSKEKEPFVRIKWVNDLFVRGKKAAGILAESADPEGSVVLGIGWNLFEPAGGFPEEAGEAGALFSDRELEEDGIRNLPRGIREELAGRFLTRFRSYYERQPQKEHMAAYRERMLYVGEEVLLQKASHERLEDEGERRVVIEGVSESGALIAREKSGKKLLLSSGEISIVKAE